MGKFKSVGLKAKKHLHDSIFVTIDDRAMKITPILVIILPNVFKFGGKLDLLICGFLSEDAHNFLDGFPNIEKLVIVSELVILDLGKVKHVLDDELHHFS